MPRRPRCTCDHENWVTFTKRTDDPKLAWLECQLAMHGIPSRRRGFSFHAPILEVPEQYEDAAWEILSPLDDVEDDDEMFVNMEGCPPDLAERFLVGGARHEEEHMEELSRRLARHGINFPAKPPRPRRA